MKKNTKIVIFSLIIAFFALAGLVPAFLVNYNTSSPTAPEVLDDGQNVCLKTSFHENFEGYRFKFAGSGDEILIDSNQNIINANLFIKNGGEIGKEYMVSVSYKNKKKGNYSNYSRSLKWLCTTYLQSPVITFDGETLLQWEEVAGADYYRVYFNNVSGETYEETNENFLNLKSIAGGEKEMYVVAYSNNDNLKNSPKSNILDFDLIHYFAEFSSIGFNRKTKILTAGNEELLDVLTISLWQGGIEEQFSIIKFDVVEEENVFVYTIDLTTIFEDNISKIGISPANKDKFNKFMGKAKILEL